MNVDLSWQKGHQSSTQTKYEQHPADTTTHLFNGKKERKKKMRGNDKGKKERKGKKKRKGWREQGREGGEKNGRKAGKMDEGVEGRRNGGRKRGKKGMENVSALTFWVFHVYTCSVSIYKISLGALWYWAGPYGIPGQKSLSGASIFWLQKIGFIQPLRPSLSSKELVQTVANWGR